jgi:hypothetical protein
MFLWVEDVGRWRDRTWGRSLYASEREGVPLVPNFKLACASATPRICLGLLSLTRLAVCVSHQSKRSSDLHFFRSKDDITTS